MNSQPMDDGDNSLTRLMALLSLTEQLEQELGTAQQPVAPTAPPAAASNQHEAAAVPLVPPLSLLPSEEELETRLEALVRMMQRSNASMQYDRFLDELLDKLRDILGRFL